MFSLIHSSGNYLSWNQHMAHLLGFFAACRSVSSRTAARCVVLVYVQGIRTRMFCSFVTFCCFSQFIAQQVRSPQLHHFLFVISKFVNPQRLSPSPWLHRVRRTIYSQCCNAWVSRWDEPRSCTHAFVLYLMNCTERTDVEVCGCWVTAPFITMIWPYRSNWVPLVVGGPARLSSPKKRVWQKKHEVHKLDESGWFLSNGVLFFLNKYYIRQIIKLSHQVIASLYYNYRCI